MGVLAVLGHSGGGPSPIVLRVYGSQVAFSGPRVLAALLALAACGCGMGERAAAQERVTLRATNSRGVPLHPAEHAREMSGRLPDGAEVEVLRWGAERRWLEVRAEDGTSGWIVARYLAVAAPRPVAVAPPDAFTSLVECQRTLRERPPPRARGPRLASWNVRWFPDGSSRGPSDEATDVDHLACAIAALDVDAVALQEIMLHARGRTAVERLVQRLDSHTGGSWRAEFDRCPRDGRQHVGWLVNQARARVEAVTQVDALNPMGGCSHHLRPGLAIRLRFSSGPDLSAISVHLDSGVEGHDFRHRTESLRALEGALAPLIREDADVLVMGDFNTMGQRAPQVSASQEIERLDATLAGLTPPLRRISSDVACTEYYRRRGGLLDHVLATVGMAEIAADARVRVAGPCARHRCALPRGVHPRALERLSDHCPIVIELAARDMD